MKFYRVHVLCEAGTSAGYEFFTSKAKAEAAMREWTAPPAREDDVAELEEIEIEPTKSGILRALNTYANHENNG